MQIPNDSGIVNDDFDSTAVIEEYFNFNYVFIILKDRLVQFDVLDKLKKTNDVLRNLHFFYYNDIFKGIYLPICKIYYQKKKWMVYVATNYEYTKFNHDLIIDSNVKIIGRILLLAYPSNALGYMFHLGTILAHLD